MDSSPRKKNRPFCFCSPVLIVLLFFPGLYSLSPYPPPPSEVDRLLTVKKCGAGKRGKGEREEWGGGGQGWDSPKKKAKKSLTSFWTKSYSSTLRNAIVCSIVFCRIPFQQEKWRWKGFLAPPPLSPSIAPLLFDPHRPLSMPHLVARFKRKKKWVSPF